jgi:putative transposase
VVCGRLGLSRQAYYQGHHRRECQEVDEAKVLQLVVKERGYQPRLGTRKLQVRIRDELAEAGVKIGRDRLFGVLRRHHLLVERQRAEYPTTTTSYHCLPVFRNQVRGREVKRPHEVWVSDLTYLRTEEGYLYLALITDKKSRKIVGFHCGDTLEASGCLKAVEMALAQLPEGARPIHHSDRGCQYCSHEYVNKLVDRGLGVSMTETDHCAENALAERMNGILKSEYGLGFRLRSKAVARALVREAVHLYNTRRPHTALGMKTPEEVHALTA